MVVNKRGWIRMMEATISIILVFGVVLVMYSKQVGERDLTEYMYSLGQEVLSDISLRNDLRSLALDSNETALSEFARTKIPSIFNFTLRVCDFEVLPCSPPDDISVRLLREKRDIYADEVIISADFGGYDPKRVKLFVWEEVSNN